MPEWTEALRSHLAALKLDPHREAEIVDELSQHLDEAYETFRTDGITDAEARRRAIQELCTPESLAEYMRPLRQSHVSPPLIPGEPRKGILPGFWRDLRIAIRSLSKTPAFAATAVVTLALAIGANVAIFSVIHAVLIEPLSFPDSDRLVTIFGSAPGTELPAEFGLNAPFYIEYKENSRSLSDLAVYQTLQGTVRSGGNVDRLFMGEATASLFSTLQVKPIIGRLPTDEDDAGDVVVLSHWLWMRWFNGDPSVLGRAINALNANREVVGILGPDFHFPHERIALWIHNRVRGPIPPPSGRFGESVFVGRLAAGADEKSLAAELAPLARRLPQRFGGSPAFARIIEKHQPVIRSLEEDLVGNLQRPLWILMGTVGIVLLIACANVANLLIVRAESRQKDAAVRRALGAGRGALIRSQMAEAVVLAACGAAGGVLLAWIGMPLLVRLAPESIPRLGSATINPTALLFTVGVGAFAALASGLLPALRFSTFEITEGLRNSTRVGRGPDRLTRDGLVVVQTAAALVLLVGSALLFQSFYKLNSVDPGYDTEDIFTFQMAPDPRKLGISDAPGAARFHYDFLDRLAALPGVQSVGLADTLPLDEGSYERSFVSEQKPAIGDGTADPRLRATFASGDYFKTMGIQLLSGTTFTRDVTPQSTVGVIVSRSAAEILWPGEDPLGKRLRESNASPDSNWMAVIGVVEDVMLADFRQAGPDPMVYLPLVGPTAKSWIVGTPAYVVKTPRSETIGPEIRNLISEVAPGAPMYRIFTMRGLAARTMAQLSFTMMTLAIASGLALVLGAVGIYGTLSYMVSQRTREIGIRLALGAQAGEVRKMVVAHGGLVALIGVVAGVTLSVLLTRLLNKLLFRVDAVDLVTLLSMSAAMLAIALLASYVPARRASSFDPIVSLRTE